MYPAVNAWGEWFGVNNVFVAALSVMYIQKQMRASKKSKKSRWELRVCEAQ